MWGDDFDLALWAELRLRGTFGNLFSGPRRRWVRRKGFHRTDNSVAMKEWVSTRPLWQIPFVKPEDLYLVPVVDLSGERKFPKEEILNIPHLSQDLLAVFDGPRILFPDGPSPEKEIRAAFIDGPGCFMSSVGTISGPKMDADLLRFATVYLRSDLVRYFMITQLYQLLSDRDRVSLSDISHFPFYLPEQHPDPETGRRIVRSIANMTRELEETNPLLRQHRWEQLRGIAEAQLHMYFGLSEQAGAIVRETVESVLPRVRPYGMSTVFDRAGLRASNEVIEVYTSTLLSELESWRNARRGTGNFRVHVLLTRIDRAGPFGVIRVNLGGSENADNTHIERTDDAVLATVDELRRLSILPISYSEDIYVTPDMVIFSGNSIYLIKPQIERAWLRRQARRDAEAIVSATTRPSASIVNVA